MLRRASWANFRRSANELQSSHGCSWRAQSSTASAERPPLTPILEQRIERDVATIIDSAIRGDRYGWRLTKTLRGEEMRLRESIHKSRISSREKTDFFAGHETELSDIEQTFPEPIPPGTFVEIRRNAMFVHGVVLGQSYIERQWQTVMLTSQGEVWLHLRGDVMFMVPSLATRDMALRCGIDQIAMGRTEVQARVEVLKRIRDFERSVEQAYNVIGRTSRLIYDHVKSSNPDEWSEVTVAEAAAFLSPHSDPSPMTFFAIHKHLMLLCKHYIADPQSYATSQTFAVRPQSHVNEIDAINNMRQKGGAAFKSFGVKSMDIMEANRRRAAQSWEEEPSQRQSDQVVWSDDDLVILSFLVNACRPKRSIQTDPYALGVASILKHMDQNISKVNDGVLYQVLIDLGVFPPWADMVSRKRDIRLDQCSEEDSPRVKEQDALTKKALSLRGTSLMSGPLGPEDLYPFDMMESIRHDFGDMPVYVLDDGHAEELDDGISIEQIPSEPNSHWVHVHIADPTSVLPPHHVFSQHAHNQLETRYFVHRTWPMLPRSLIRECLSLGTGSAPGGSERVLTFSLKINEGGEMIDYNVRPGIVRNLHIMPYDGADMALGPGYTRNFYPFGGEDPSLRSPSVNLDPVHLNNLRALNAISNLSVARRLGSPVFNLDMTTRDLTMSDKIFSQDYQPSSRPTWFRGFPELTYAVTDSTHGVVGCRRMVAEIMRLACWAASRFCSDRDIPVMRRWAPPYLIPSASKLADLLAVRNASGYVDYSDAIRHGIIIPPAQFSLQPKGHWSIGILEGEGYLRVTSPIRRYSDMVAHWQIKHSLLNEKLPFSVERLEEFVKYSTIRGKIQKREDVRHQNFWALQFIKRWMEDPRRKEGDADPLQSLVATPFNVPVLNFTTKEFICGARIRVLGIEGFLHVRDRHDIRMGEDINVKIREVVLGNEPQLILVKR